MNAGSPILEVLDLAVSFDVGRNRRLEAVCAVSLDLKKGETLGLVGESGCGKSSLARAVIQLPRPAAGQVRFHGEDLTQVSAKRLKQLRPRLQMIFQDSVAALNPRRKVGETIAMPIAIAGNGHRNDRRVKARAMMQAVGLDPDAFDRRPFQFSGGQCQRIQLARALMARPEILICDEPVSSLDVSIQAQILNLLEKMRIRFGLSMLFISHDMAVVNHVADRVAVMYLGHICETAPTVTLFRAPAHPYTVALIAAIPSPQAGFRRKCMALRVTDAPSAIEPPPGCRFHPRCPSARKVCSELAPQLTELAPQRRVACHFPII